MNQKTINFIFAALIVVALGFAIFGGKTTERIIERVRDLGGITNYDTLSVGEEVIYEIDPLSTKATFDDIATRWVGGIIASGSNLTCWTNDEVGDGVWIDSAFMGYRFGEIASTSLKMQLLHDADGTIAASNDFGTLSVNASSSILALTTYATSTSATTTSMTSQVLLTSTVGTTVFVPDGESVCLYLQAVDDNSCTETGQCGGATTTDRGVDPFFQFQYHRAF